MKYNKDLTVEELKNDLHYNPDTGAFTRLVSRSGVSAGKLAGGLNAKGYFRVKVFNKTYAGHRVAWLYMTGELPSDQIDHINHDRGDNRFINLRQVDNSENQKNSNLSPRSTTGFTGVMQDKASLRWRGQVTVEGKRVSKRFSSFNAAKEWRINMNEKHGYHKNHGVSL